jgi:hypothetical protein
VVLVLVLAVAIILLLYFFRSKGRPSYIETTLGAKERAEEQISKMDLVSIHKSLLIYALANDGKFPDTPEELTIEAGLPRYYIFLPSRPAEDHVAVYIAGQNESMPGSNILIYQAQMPPDGTCLVLRLNGDIEALTAEEIADAVHETLKHVDY